MTVNFVHCPNCETEFDAVQKALRTRPCPGCNKTWRQLHQLVDPAVPDGEDVQIEYPIDGPGGVRR